MVPSISQRDIIKSFTGLRPVLESGDFYIEISSKQPNFIQVAEIQSPELNAVLAIAEFVKDLLKKDSLVLTEKSSYEPTIPELPGMRSISPVDALIKTNPAYGEIVCRCESVSEAEIVAAVRHGHTYKTMPGVNVKYIVPNYYSPAGDNKFYLRTMIVKKVQNL